MDTQNQSTIANIPRQRVVDERGHTLGITTRQPNVSVRVISAPCGSGASTSQAGLA